MVSDEVVRSEITIEKHEKNAVFEDETQGYMVAGETDSEGEDSYEYIDTLLDETDVFELASKTDTRIIYILGDTKSGKTTFETLLYHLFYSHIDDEWYFAGSDTLPAFEARRQNILIDGRNPEGLNMERTWPGDGHHVFLHMNLRNMLNGEFKHILLTDISGEDYKNCSSNRSLIDERLPLVAQADRLIIFLDAKKLLDPMKRAVVIKDAISFLRMLRDKYDTADVTPPVVYFAISKSDRLSVAEKEYADFVYNIRDRFSVLGSLFEMNFYWITIKDWYKPSDKRHTAALDFLKNLLKDKKKVLPAIDRNEIENGLEDEFNRLRRRWVNE